jgi:hypothetical protein
MSASKKIGLKKDFSSGFYLIEAQNPKSPPPTHTHTLYTCITYTYSHMEGGKRVEPEKGKGQ